MTHHHPIPTPATLLQTIQFYTQQLESSAVSFGHGTTNAHDEACWLVLWLLGLPLDTDINAPAHAQRPVSDDQRHRLQTLFERRIKERLPAAYLTQEAWLQGLAFYCDERSIVPRSLVAELLADATLDPWLSDQTQRLLDLCTGNGSLAVLAALTYPDITVVAADISAPALEVAAINVARYDLAQRIALCQSDGLAQVPGRFDLVLCNPPYVNAQSMQNLPAEYRAEPALALAGGADGMDFIRQLLRQLPRHLNPEGILVLEIGNERVHFEAAFASLEVVWLPTSAGDDQVLLVQAHALHDWADTVAAPD